MGRRKEKGNEWRPRYVGCDKHGWFYRNRRTGEFLRLRDESDKILPPESTEDQVWSAYNSLGKTRSKKTFDTVIDKYLKSPSFLNLGQQTQIKYLRAIQTRAKYNLRKSFGNMEPNKLSIGVIVSYQDSVAVKHPSAAEDDMKVLSVILAWAIARELVSGPNPCKNLPRVDKPESCAKAYPDEDHAAFYFYLLKNNHIAHAGAMEIAYLCAARQQDVLSLHERPPAPIKKNNTETDLDFKKRRASQHLIGHLRDDGIWIRQAKTHRMKLVNYNERLKAAISLLLTYKYENTSAGNITARSRGPHLIVKSNGGRYTRSGFNSTWNRRKREALDGGVISENFRFHDSKHKAITDFEGTEAEKLEFSDHANKSMMDKYNHSVKVVDAVQRPLLGKKNGK